MAARAGITIGVASDSPGDVIQEMEAMIELGYSTLQALCAGTGRSAQICGVANEVGTLEPGKLADLLIVEADPLERIGNLAQVRNVLKQGTVVRQGSQLVLTPPPRP